MIAYNSEALDNLHIQEEAEKARKKDRITAEELVAIKTAHPFQLYTTNIYMRIGIFILTTIVVQFSFGFFMLMMNNSGERGLGVLSLFYSIGCYAAAEFMVREKKHYKSGADTALLWGAGGFGISAMFLIYGSEPQLWVIFALLTLITVYFILRFADVIMSIIAHVSLLGLIFCIGEKLGTIGKVMLPFLVMLTSLGVYLLVLKLSTIKTYRHYQRCLKMIQCCALITLYLGGNYYVVRELSIAMFSLNLLPGQDITAGWLFWILTIALPLVYVYAGIRRKDRILLGIGLLLIAGMVYTIRTYYHVLPIELAMTFGGIVMIGIAYGLMRYLKTPRHGFTADSDEERNTMEALQLESLIIAQTMSHPSTPSSDQYNFGGGTGGGGGASGDY